MTNPLVDGALDPTIEAYDAPIPNSCFEEQRWGGKAREATGDVTT